MEAFVLNKYTSTEKLRRVEVEGIDERKKRKGKNTSLINIPPA